MEGRELDPYEQQLLAVFDSCDKDQSGSLDGRGLEQLCEKLQLEEQGIELIKCLLGSSSNNKVTFGEFRDGLLTLLGDDQVERPNRRDAGDRGSPEREVSPKFVFGKKKYGRRSRPESTEQDLTVEQDERSDHSDLEIFVPVEDKTNTVSMSSVPESSPLEDIKEQKTGIHNPVDRKGTCLPGSQNSGMAQVSLPSWQITSEVSELCYEKVAPSVGRVAQDEEECLRAAWKRLGVGKDGFLDRGELALLCECIGMQKVAEEVVQQLFEKLDVDRDGHISFDEFLLLFRSGGSWVQPNVTQIQTGNETNRERLETDFQQCAGNTKERQTLGSSDQDSQFLAVHTNSAGCVSAEVIVEMWEAAGISGPSRLLQDLGFNSSQQINIADLADVLEEELRSLADERRNSDAAGVSIHSCSPHEILLQATLALYQTEVRCLKLSLEHMTGERDKLRADIMDANERASLLAQEVDDHHARLEKYSQLQVKLLERRHAEQLKELSEQLGSDREQFAVQNLSLEKQVSSLQEEESRLRIQVTTLQLDNEALDKENHSLTEQLLKSEETRLQLQKELESLVGLQQHVGEMEGCSEKEEVLPLIEKLNELQAENTGLRDRNDELTMEVEALIAKLASLKTKKTPLTQASCDAVDGVTSVEGTRIPPGGYATKRRGNLATEDSSEEESPRLGKMRRCCGGSGDSKDASLEAVNMEGLQIHPLGHGESGVEADLGIDDFTDSSFGGEGQVRGRHCNEWDNSEVLPLISESGLISDLKDHIANLEQELKLKSEKLVVCETERSRLKANITENPHSVAVEEPDKEKSVKQVKGQLKQVFQVIRKQVLQELLEEDGKISSLQEYCNSHNQRNEHNDLPGKTNDGNMSTVANFCFLHTSTPSSMNGITPDPLENTKDVKQLEKHCRNLKSQLDLVKTEIVKIISEKKACSKENCALKIHISRLKNRLPMDEVLKDVSCFHSCQNDPGLNRSQGVSTLIKGTNDVAECTRTGYSDVAVNKSVSGNHVTEVSTVKGTEVGDAKADSDVHNLIEHNEEVMTDKGGDVNEKDELGVPEKPSEHDSSAKNISSSLVLQVEEFSETWKTEEETRVIEITELRERCCELEKSLELLRQEYEKCEDYWANKLEEERRLYEQEQKLSDEKFSELMSKIREYEEMFGAQEDDSDILSTIEERGSLEKQFTDLEEEFVEFRHKAELEQAEKEKELAHLRGQLKTLEQRNKHAESKLNVAVQVSDLENGSWESDCKFVVELDGARKAIKHKEESQRLCKIVSEGAALYSSRSNSPQRGSSAHCDHIELIHLRNVKQQLDDECHALRHQKEMLVQEVTEIQTRIPHCQNTGAVLPPHLTSGAKVGGQACRIDLNILQALNARLRQQEQQCHHLQVALKQQQQSESILQCTLQEHKEKVASLQSALQTTQEKLNQQTSACKEQMERLARTDILVKDLYVENAYLVATVQRLQQHCHVLVQMTSDSSSV